jgi:hypothetical protein
VLSTQTSQHQIDYVPVCPDDRSARNSTRFRFSRRLLPRIGPRTVTFEYGAAAFAVGTIGVGVKGAVRVTIVFVSRLHFDSQEVQVSST